jgi:hypothetical protein
VTHSNSKAEYVAISEAIREICFIYYLLESTDIKIDGIMLVRFLCLIIRVPEYKLDTSTQISILCKNHIEDGFVIIVFCEIMQACCRPFTKYVKKEISMLNV